MSNIIKKIRWVLVRALSMGLYELFVYRPVQLLKSTKLYYIICFKGKNEPMKAATLGIKYVEFDKLNFDKARDIYKYCIFEYEIDLCSIDDWRKDYKNNITSPIQFKGKIDKQKFSCHGDVKYIHNLSRLHHLPFLAIDYVQRKSNAYQIINKHLNEWDKQNPYMYSINWTSGIEVSIRAINLVYTYLILNEYGLLNEHNDKLIKKIVYQSFLYLENNLSKHSSANNHLLAELGGLVVISSFFNCKKLDRKKQYWERRFSREVKRQFLPDGVHFELSTRYHAEMLDILEIAYFFIRSIQSSVQPSINYDHVIQNAKKFIASSVDLGVVEFGDSDGGHVLFPYFQKEFNLYRSLLGINNSNNTDLRVEMLCGKGETNSSIRQSQLEHYKDAGYTFLFDRDSDFKCVFDHGDLGDGLMQAHGHSDILHFTVHVCGIPIIVDSGTYQYHVKDICWRNYFRGASAHNTISIAESNHAMLGTRMSWRSNPGARLNELFETRNLTKVGASFFWKRNLVHERILEHDISSCSLKIIDNIKVEGSYPKLSKGSFYLNLNPELVWSLEKNELVCSLASGKKISIVNERFINASIISAKRNPKLGWYSTNYDSMREGLVLLFDFSVEESKSFETLLSY